MPETYAETAAAAADRLRELTGVASHDVALVLGSGWLPAVDALGGEEAGALPVAQGRGGGADPAGQLADREGGLGDVSA